MFSLKKDDGAMTRLSVGCLLVNGRGTDGQGRERSEAVAGVAAALAVVLRFVLVPGAAAEHTPGPDGASAWGLF